MKKNDLFRSSAGQALTLALPHNNLDMLEKVAA